MREPNSGISRREVLTGGLGISFAQTLRSAQTSDDFLPVLDIHCHPPFPTRSESWVLRHQRSAGIRTTACFP